MRILTTFIFILFVSSVFAQVGVGTTTPKAQLDIVASNQATPANTDGILVPRIDAFPSTNPTADQNGMLVFLTTDKTFYYWDHGNTTWVAVNNPNGVVQKIDDLSDVDTSTSAPTNGQVLSWNGTNWVPADDAPANFSMISCNLGGTDWPTAANNSWQVIPFNTLSFDVNSEFSTATHRFTPTEAGYYQVNAQFNLKSPTTDIEYGIGIYKNTDLMKESIDEDAAGGNLLTRQISGLLYMNGSTDYIELRAKSNNPNSYNIDGWSGKTFLDIHRVR